MDSSVLVALAFDERGAPEVARRIKAFDQIVAAPLLEAEVRSAGLREQRTIDDRLFEAVEWIHPERALRVEVERVLAAGYVRGADCWHLATALYLSPDPHELVFLTLDERQRDVAKTLGFAT